MKTRLAFLSLVGVVSAFAGYTYDFSYLPASTTNGDLTATYSAPYIYTAFSGGSIILTTSVPTTPNDYEIKTPLSILAGGGTFIHFLRASSGANATPSACSGDYLSAELVVGSGYVSGVTAATVNVNQCTSGSRTHLNGFSTTVTPSSIMRSVIYGTTILVYIDDRLLASQTVSSTTGQPGVGGYGMTGNSGFLNNTPTLQIGHHDTGAPLTVSSIGLRTSVLPTEVSLQWQGAADDSIGIGVYEYEIKRNGSLVGNTNGAEFADSGLTAATTYAYSIAAIDYHGNKGSAVTFSVTTPPSSTVDPRRTGVMATGSYWGGGGEQIDMLSGNLNFSIPLVTAKSRTGWSVPVGLSYNSQNWRQDGGANWQLGADVGFGYGWKMQIGAITPYYNGTGSGVHHYVFTDGTGAEYRLDDPASSGIWSSKQGIYVWYEAAANKLHFKNGMFWYMGCTSGGEEGDAGTMYPTVIEDKAGNQVIVTYAGAASLPSSSINSSSRILLIEDTHAAGATQYVFGYYGTGSSAGHLSYVRAWPNGFAVNLAQPGYTTGAGLMPPYGTDSAYSGKTTTQLSSIVVPTAGSWQFTYDSAGASELLKAQFPWGGYLRWTYATATYSGSRLLREIDNRYIFLSATSGGGATEDGPYPITHSDTGISGGIPTVHTDSTLVDASGNGAKKWTFNTSSGTPWQIGLPSQFEQKTSASGTTITQDSYTWSQTATSSNPYISTKVAVKDPGTGSAASAQTTQTVDQYGNTTQSIVYPYNNTTTPLATYNSTFITSSSYVANYLRGLLSSATVTVGSTTTTLVTNTFDSYSGVSCSGGVSGTPAYEYDPAGVLSPAGNLVKSVTPAGTSAQCYSYGIPFSATATDGTVTSATFSSTTNFAMPDAVTTPTYSDALTYDAWLGVTHTTGANLENMYTSYDSLGRPSSATSPYGTYGTPTVTYAYSSSGTVPVWQTATGPDGFTRTTLDGFGRSVQLERGPSSSAIYTTMKTEYAPCACSPLGKLKRTTQPYTQTGSPIWTTADAVQHWTTFTYDGIGRTLSAQQPDGASTTTYAYAGNQTTVTDPAGKWKTFTSDVSGNLTTVTEPDPAAPTTSTYTTTYAYDWMNHLTGTSMTRGGTTQTRTFAYDTAGRLTSATNPESGTVAYTYNTDNTLATKTDAKGQVAVYSYDSAKRVTMTQQYLYSGGSEDICQRVTYGYDAGTNGQGRLTSKIYGHPPPTAGGYPMYTACPGTAAPYAYEEDYSYHAAGGVTGKAFTITMNVGSGGSSSASVSTGYSYDSAGRMATSSYPNLYGYWPTLTFTYGYDSMGRPVSMADDDPGSYSGTGTTWVQNGQYDVAGRRTSLQLFSTYTSGAPAYVTESSTYNANGQLITLNSSAWPGIGVTYNYSTTQNNGQIISAVDTVSGDTIVYTYDALKRLISAASTPNSGSTPTAWTQGFQYDGFGNLTAKVLNGTTTSIGVTAATNRLSSATYDLNGNMVSGAGASLTYDESNRLASASPTSGGTEYYGYAADNKRIYRYNPSTSVEEWTLYGARGERVGVFGFTSAWSAVTVTPLETEVWFGGKLVRRTSSSGFGVPFRDRVGSERAGRAEYRPYGEEITSTANGTEKFGTYTRDSFTTLDYADQRYYASSYGRFNTADPYRASAGVGDPGSWNRYAYVKGDPVNFRDPAGLCAEDTNTSVNVCDTFDDLPGGNNQRTPRATPPGPTPAQQKRWSTAQEGLESALGLLGNLASGAIAMNPECESDLNGIQKDTKLSLGRIADEASFAGKEDGTTSQSLYRDLFVPGSSDYNHSGSFTIGTALSQPGTGTKAVAALPGSALHDTIFFNPVFVNSHSAGYNAALLLHESIHLLGFTDSVLMQALDFNPNDEISDHATALIAKDCFGVTR